VQLRFEFCPPHPKEIGSFKEIKRRINQIKPKIERRFDLHTLTHTHTPSTHTHTKCSPKREFFPLATDFWTWTPIGWRDSSCRVTTSTICTRWNRRRLPGEFGFWVLGLGLSLALFPLPKTENRKKTPKQVSRISTQRKNHLHLQINGKHLCHSIDISHWSVNIVWPRWVLKRTTDQSLFLQLSTKKTNYVDL